MRIRPALISAVFGLLLFVPSALAQDGERTPLNLSEPKADAAQAAGSTGGGLVRTIVGLAIVIGVIYGLYWVLKQVKASREERASGSGLRPLATLPLGGTRSLQLVRAGHEVVLVGVGESGVTAIRTYSEAEARALGLLDDDAEDGGTISSTPAAHSVVAGIPGNPKPPARGPFKRALEQLRSRTVIR